MYPTNTPLKIAVLVIITLSLLSCRQKIFLDNIDKAQFCSYFKVVSTERGNKGDPVKGYFVKTGTVPNDKVSDFIQLHAARFEYLAGKEFINLLKAADTIIEEQVKQQFCKTISGDTFYNQFFLLTNAKRNPGDLPASFSAAELMKIASRFFMCDGINPKDRSISYHICGGINGIADLRVTRDFTALEAFCVEAIFFNLDRKPGFLDKFEGYIARSVRTNKPRAVKLKTYLKIIREECFTDMEKDKNLKEALLAYYVLNKDSFNFSIE